MQLTKDTDKIFCLIYEEYLNRRKADIPKSEAKSFQSPGVLQTEFLQGMPEDDICEALAELEKNKLITRYIHDDFRLSNDGITFMENRFKNSLKEVTDFIAKFIP